MQPFLGGDCVDPVSLLPSVHASSSPLSLHLLQEERCGAHQPSHHSGDARHVDRSSTSEGQRGGRRGSSVAPARGAVAGGRAGDHKVGAGQAGGVTGVNDDGFADEGSVAGGRGRDVEVGVAGLEGAAGDVAVLAGEIPDLAGLRVGVVAGGDLTADVGVDVGAGGGAVAVGGDRHGVNVVHCRGQDLSAIPPRTMGMPMG